MKIFRLLAKRSLRVGLIVLLVGAVVGFGHFMTPRGPDAWASVVWDLDGAMRGMPAYMQTQVEEGAVQEVHLNGNTLYYTLYRSSKPVPALLDYYEGLYASDSTDRQIAPPEAKQAYLRRIQDTEERAVQEERITTTEEILNDRFIRFQGEGWGGFSTIVTGAESELDYSAQMADSFAAFKKSGLASDLGQPKIVVAFEDPAAGDTQYFNVWPGDDFDHRKVMPRGEEDAPGHDPEDVQRPWGSRRMITFGQNHQGVDFEIFVYRGRGTVDDVHAHFMTEMLQDGWSLSSRFEDSRAQMPDPLGSLLFIKEGQEAYISLENRADLDMITSTVVLYSRGG